MKGFFFACNAYRSAFNLLFSKKFVHFLIFPVILLLVMFYVGNLITNYVGNSLFDLFKDQLRESLSSFPALSWLNDVTGWLLMLIVKFIYYILYVMYSGYIVMIIMSPVYSILSEKIESHFTGKQYLFSWSVFFHDVIRGILISLRNMFLQTFLSIILFILSFIPVVSLMTPFLMLILTSYFYGFSFLDYAIERRCANVKSSVRFVHSKFWETIGIGSVFTLALMLPIMNVFVCSFVSLAAVIASTIVVVLPHISESKKSY